MWYVFELRHQLIKDYESYVSSFIRIKDERTEEQVRQGLDEGLLWPDPLIQLGILADHRPLKAHLSLAGDQQGLEQ